MMIMGGHGGPGRGMSLTKPFFCFVQGLLLWVAGTSVHRLPYGEIPAPLHQPDEHIEAPTWHEVKLLENTAPLQHAPTPPGFMTSSSVARIKQSAHQFIFSGHGGPGRGMSLTKPFFCFVQGLLLWVAGTSVHRLPYGEIPAPLHQPDEHIEAPTWHEVKLLENTAPLQHAPTPPGFMTSSSVARIKQSAHQFIFSGHGGPGRGMSLTKPFFCFVQGLLLWVAGTSVHRLPYGEIPAPLHQPDEHIEAPTWHEVKLLENTAPLQHAPTPPGFMTSSSVARIKQSAHQFIFSGHGGPGRGMSLTKPFFCFVQVTLKKRKLLWESAKHDKSLGKKVSLQHDKLRINNDMYIWNDKTNQREIASNSRTGQHSD
ncbi:uncharacterized protein [Dermacentor albipictus]|uniref:uncharacterized protein n=1 Tax=Dermacentor albipictus TaxID=60249 RepID=UPI0031FD1828